MADTKGGRLMDKFDEKAREVNHHVNETCDETRQCRQCDRVAQALRDVDREARTEIEILKKALRAIELYSVEEHTCGTEINDSCRPCSITHIARAALAQPYSAPQSSLTREQAEKMAGVAHGHDFDYGYCLTCSRIADALMSVAGSKDTRMLDWLEQNCLRDGNHFRFTVPMWYEGNDKPASLRKSIAVRAAIESEEPHK